MVPTYLQDNILELEAYVRSHTAQEIYEIDGDVPKEVISCKKSVRSGN